MMTSRSSSHEDFQSMTLSEESTVSEGTRRLLSPYNRNRFDLLNRDIHNELIKVKETFRTLINDLNAFENVPEQLKEFKEKLRQLNRLLLTIRQRHDILDDRNEQILLDCQNQIWDIAKYLVRIEIYLCTIEHMKHQSNEYLQWAKKRISNDTDQFSDFGIRLKNDLQRLIIRTRIDCQNVFIQDSLEKLEQRHLIISKHSDRNQLKQLRNFQVKKSILSHCRHRLLD